MAPRLRRAASRPGPLRGELGAVLAGEAGGVVGLAGNVERREAQRVGELDPGPRGQIERPQQVEPGTVRVVSRHLELGAHRREAHLAPGGIDGRAHAGLHQLARLPQQLRGDRAVGLRARTVSSALSARR